MGIFQVYKKSNKYDYEDVIDVYAVRDDKNGYPQFLIYENNEWRYVSAKYFKNEF